MSSEDGNMDNGGETLHTWLTYGIVPEYVYPMMEGDFTMSGRDVNPPHLDSSAVDGSMPSFIPELGDEGHTKDHEVADKNAKESKPGSESPDLTVEGDEDESHMYNSPYSQDQFVECFLSPSVTNEDRTAGTDFTPTPCPIGKGASKRRLKRVLKNKRSSPSSTASTLSDPRSENSSPSLQISSPTPTTPSDLANRKKSKDDDEPSGIHDGSNGWTDLKSNRFLRRQFFDYFNQNKVECLKCPPDRERRSFRPTFNLMNYYYTAKSSVPLESYYYGLCTGRNIDTADCCPATLKCPDCGKSVAKVDIFRHIVAHLKWKNDISNALVDRVCKYCLSPVRTTSNMDAHTDKCHKVLSDVGHCCRICCAVFEDEIKTTIHMWETHCESEMPYQCFICDYRSSFLYEVVDHCDQVHSHMKRLICPICLKGFTFIAHEDIFNNLKQHVMGHMLKTDNIDCNSCVLRFVDDFDYIQHKTDKSLHKTGKDCRGFHQYEPPNGTPSLMMALDPNSIEVEEIPCVHLRESNVNYKTEKMDCRQTKDPNEKIDSHEKVFARVLQQMNPSPVKVPPPPEY